MIETERKYHLKTKSLENGADIPTKVLILRPAAIGDVIYASPIPRLLKANGVEEVVFFTQKSGEPVLRHNPYIDKIETRGAEGGDEEKITKAVIELLEEYSPTHYPLRLAFGVESRYLWRTDGAYGKLPTTDERRKVSSEINYYDVTLEWAGFPNAKGPRPEIYLSDKEKEEVISFLREKPGFTMMWILAGSTYNKRIVHGPDYIKMVLERCPQSFHFICGDSSSRYFNVISDRRVQFKVGEWDLRKTIVMTSAVDLVISPESAIINAAGAFKTPKLLLLSHSNHNNLAKYWHNTYSFRPTCECSPCYLIPIEFKNIRNYERRNLARRFYLDCLLIHPQDIYRPLSYRCVASLPHNEIVGKIEELYKQGPIDDRRKNRWDLELVRSTLS